MTDDYAKAELLVYSAAYTWDPNAFGTTHGRAFNEQGRQLWDFLLTDRVPHVLGALGKVCANAIRWQIGVPELNLDGIHYGWETVEGPRACMYAAKIIAIYFQPAEFQLEDPLTQQIGLIATQGRATYFEVALAMLDLAAALRLHTAKITYYPDGALPE